MTREIIGPRNNIATRLAAAVPRCRNSNILVMTAPVTASGAEAKALLKNLQMRTV